jgi:ribosome-associated translation inhibitor RaiA
MRTTVSGKNIDNTNALKERVEKKHPSLKDIQPDTEAQATLR